MRKLGAVAALMAAAFTVSACIVVPLRPRPYGYYGPPAPAIIVARPGRYHY